MKNTQTIQTFKEFISESKITKDSYIAYDITDPVSINKYGTGFQGKQPFKTELEAKSSFGSDRVDDIAVTTIGEFEKKFKTKIL